MSNKENAWEIQTKRIEARKISVVREPFSWPVVKIKFPQVTKLYIMPRGSTTISSTNTPQLSQISCEKNHQRECTLLMAYDKYCTMYSKIDFSALFENGRKMSVVTCGHFLKMGGKCPWCLRGTF